MVEDLSFGANTRNNLAATEALSQHLLCCCPLNSIHLPYQAVDVILPVAQVTPLHEMLEFSSPEAPGRIAELERPQKIAGLFEVRSHSEDLVNQVLHAHDAIFAQVGLNERIVGQRDPLLLDLPIATFVDQLTDGLEVRIAVGDIRFNDLEHLQSGLGEANKDAIVDLQKTQKLKDFTRLRCNLVDTTQSPALA